MDPLSRRAMLGTLAGGAVVAVTLRGLPTLAADVTDVDIANFALNLEYLEAEFYTYAVTGQGISARGIAETGTGTSGETTGGARVPFRSKRVQAIAEQIAHDEQSHVKLLRSVLGDKAIAKPAINLAALGIGFKDEMEFLTVSRALEDVGVSAYGGAAPLITSKDILGAAARILADEAYHASNIRLLVDIKRIRTSAVDGKDVLPPPSGQNYFLVDNGGLTITRTPAEVIAIAKPFMPQGLNGNIR